MSSRTPTEKRGSRRRFFQKFAAAAATVFAMFSPKARAYDSEWDELGGGPGKGREKSTTGREKALEHGRGKGLDTAPPMSPPPPPPPPPPPTTPPPGL